MKGKHLHVWVTKQGEFTEEEVLMADVSGNTPLNLTLTAAQQLLHGVGGGVLACKTDQGMAFLGGPTGSFDDGDDDCLVPSNSGGSSRDFWAGERAAAARPARVASKGPSRVGSLLRKPPPRQTPPSSEAGGPADSDESSE